MPWKNAGGLTTEIASYPPGAPLDAFDWRVSVADVARDGPFSQFMDIDRIIVLIDGGGVRLAGAGQRVELRARFEPYAFRGDDEIDCMLLEGPVRDFNLMVRRGRARGDVIVVQNEGVRVAPARFHLCYSVTGTCECLVAGHPPLVVTMDHALYIEDDPEAPAALAVNPLTADSVALVASVLLAP